MFNDKDAWVYLVSSSILICALLNLSCTNEGSFHQREKRQFSATSHEERFEHGVVDDHADVSIQGQPLIKRQHPTIISSSAPEAPKPAESPLVLGGEVLSEEGATANVPKPKTDTDFNAWCEKALETKIMTSSLTISSLLDEFCDASIAKPMLTNTLLENAHTIGGDVQITFIRDVKSSDKQTTSARFGYAIKMPNDIKDYFDRVRSHSTKLEVIKEAAEGPGGTAKIDIIQLFDRDGPHHIRGVLSHQIVNKDASGRRVTVEYDFKNDDYLFEDGLSYMLTGTVAKAYQTMKINDTLAALVKVQGQSYMVLVVEIVVYNRGYPGIAEPNLKKNIQMGSNALWTRLVKYAQR